MTFYMKLEITNSGCGLLIVALCSMRFCLTSGKIMLLKTTFGL
jgi:hypothetical protein